MKKNKILGIVLAAFVVIVLVLVGAIFLFPDNLAKISGHPKAPTSSSTPAATAKPIDLTTTKQFTGVSAKYSQFMTNGTLNDTPAPIMVLGVATATSYVDNAIFNPYFVSGYWGTKDNYMQDSLKKYVSPYLSKNLNKTFLDAASDPSKPVFQQTLGSKIYFPEAGMQINPQCYATWQTDYCFANPQPTIESLSYKGISPTQVQVILTAVINVQYQKPGAPDGNMVSQSRAYNFSFVLDKTNPPTSKDTDLPIMTISSMDASLEIRGQSDYLINEG